MAAADNIYLVGPMGVGKTTIGRQLARGLDKEFFDSDREIEDRTGAAISLIFDLEGEEGFRRRETEMLARLTGRDGVVLATGGGTVLSAENRSMLVTRGFVVYLHAPVDLLFERTCRDRNRPLLQTDDPRSRLEEIIAKRDPLYRGIADLVLETDGRTTRRIVKEILRSVPQ